MEIEKVRDYIGPYKLRSDFEGAGRGGYVAQSLEIGDIKNVRYLGLHAFLKVIPWDDTQKVSLDALIDGLDLASDFVLYVEPANALYLFDAKGVRTLTPEAVGG